MVPEALGHGPRSDGVLQSHGGHGRGTLQIPVGLVEVRFDRAIFERSDRIGSAGVRSEKYGQGHGVHKAMVGGA